MFDVSKPLKIFNNYWYYLFAIDLVAIGLKNKLSTIVSIKLQINTVKYSQLGNISSLSWLLFLSNHFCFIIMQGNVLNPFIIVLAYVVWCFMLKSIMIHLALFMLIKINRLQIRMCIYVQLIWEMTVLVYLRYWFVTRKVCKRHNFIKKYQISDIYLQQGTDECTLQLDNYHICLFQS